MLQDLDHLLHMSPIGRPLLAESSLTIDLGTKSSPARLLLRFGEQAHDAGSNYHFAGARCSPP
jgi:hypothetical protein